MGVVAEAPISGLYCLTVATPAQPMSRSPDALTGGLPASCPSRPDVADLTAPGCRNGAGCQLHTESRQPPHVQIRAGWAPTRISARGCSPWLHATGDHL